MAQSGGFFHKPVPTGRWAPWGVTGRGRFSRSGSRSRSLAGEHIPGDGFRVRVAHAVELEQAVVPGVGREDAPRLLPAHEVHAGREADEAAEGPAGARGGGV